MKRCLAKAAKVAKGDGRTAKDNARRGVSRSALERMAIIWALICRPGEIVNATLLAERFEVSTKSVQRDIDFMRDRVGLPIRYCQQTRRYLTDDSTVLPWWLNIPRPSSPSRPSRDISPEAPK